MDGELTKVEKLPKEPLEFSLCHERLAFKKNKKKEQQEMQGCRKQVSIFFKVSMGYEILHFLPRNICAILMTNVSLRAVHEA